MRDESTALAALRQAVQIVTQFGSSLLWRQGGGPIEDNGNGYREWDILSAMTDWSLKLTLAVLDLRWALDSTDSGLKDRLAITEVLFHAARAQAYHEYANHGLAVNEANQALQLMSAITAVQVVDRDDWLRLGDALIEIVPGSLGHLAAGITAGYESLVPALKSEVNIRVRRLQARALYAQGNLDAALALRGVTTCSLEPGAVGEDDFFEYDVPWLVEARRYDEAGERVAMYICWFALSDAHVDIIRALIDERLADPKDKSVWWPLCVMRICAYDDYLLENYFGDLSTLAAHSPTHARLFGALTRTSDKTSAARQIFTEARRLAEERHPGHPWIERFSILVEKEQALIDDAQVAARFEALVAGGLREGTTLAQYVYARVRALGLPQALNIAPPEVPSAVDALRFAGVVNGGEAHSRLESTPRGLEAMIEELPDSVRMVAQAIWRSMYCYCLEQGLVRMERFFATGVGLPGDANPHYYARLCNNLAIAISEEARYDEAIQLSLKGLQASPMPGHYAQILNAINGKRITPHIWKAMDPQTQTAWRQYYIDNAEILWRYVSEERYDHTRPNEWIQHTVLNLHYLNRHDEIPLWLQRLINWQEELADEDPLHLSEEALYARTRCLQYLSSVVTHLSASRVMINDLKAQLMRSSNAELLGVAGVVFGSVGQIDDAIFFYERHLLLNPRATETDLKWVSDISRNLEHFRARQAGATKTRWRPWQ